MGTEVSLDMPAVSRRNQRWTLIVAILGSSMAFIDGSVVNVALPAIQEALAASTARMQWVVNAYMLFLGALMLLGGAAGDRWGRRRTFELGVVMFGVASVACGLSPDSLALVLARAVQGAGGALLVPGSLALISAHFDEEGRGRAIGTWAAFSALTTAAGPLLGGWLVDMVSWRAIFLINVPFVAVTLWASRRHVPESRPEGAGPLDWGGGVLAVAGFGALTSGLIAASGRGLLDVAVAGPTLAGVVLLMGFVAVEARVSNPMLPLALFRSRAFAGANVLTVLLYCALSAVLFLLPFNLIAVRGYSATQAGGALMPFTLVLAGLSRWAGGLSQDGSGRWPLILGPLVVAAAFGLLALPGGHGPYWRDFLPGLLALGLGMAISIAPLTTTVMNAVDDRHAGTASGVNNAAARIAGLLAVAVLGTLAVAAYGSRLEDRLASLDLPTPVRQEVLGHGHQFVAPPILDHLGAAQREAVETAIAGSFVGAFRLVMAVSAGLAILAAVSGAMIGGVPVLDETQ